MIPRVHPGDSIRNTSTLNRVIDNVNGLYLNQGQGPQDGIIEQAGTPVTILNSTGRDLGLGEAFPISLTDAHPYPDVPERMLQGTIITARIPDEGDPLAWGICAQTIQDDCAGKAYLAGVILARVQDADSSGDHADIDISGDWYWLKSGDTGPGKIIWLDDTVQDDGWRWALVQFPFSVGGGGFSVVQATANGSSGSITAKAITLKADVTASPNYDLGTDVLTLNYFKS